jgi:hypothetical protein
MNYEQSTLNSINNKQVDVNSILFDGMLSIFLLIIYVLSALCSKKHRKKENFNRAKKIQMLERIWMLSSNSKKKYQIEKLTRAQQIQILERAWTISPNK